MKRLAVPFLLFLLAIGLCSLPQGCTTNQQTIGYKTIYSLESGTTATYQGYLDLVIKGQVPTNDVPKVAKAYNIFHSAAMVALDGVAYNTNALASSSLVVEAQDVVNLIGVAKGGK